MLWDSDRQRKWYEFRKAPRKDSVNASPLSAPLAPPTWGKAGITLQAPLCPFRGQGQRHLTLSARSVAAVGLLLTSLSLFKVPAGIRPVCSEAKSIFLYFVLSQAVTIY